MQSALILKNEIPNLQNQLKPNSLWKNIYLILFSAFHNVPLFVTALMKASSLSLEKRTQFGKPRVLFNRFPCTDVEFAIEREKKEKKKEMYSVQEFQLKVQCSVLLLLDSFGYSKTLKGT